MVAWTLTKTPLLAIAVVLTARAAAAECVAGPPAFFAEHADVVFSGTARTVESVDASDWARRNKARLVTFDVEHSWKGAFRSPLRVYVYTRSIEGFRIDHGKTYLVFAHSAGDEERLDLDVRQAEAYVIGQCGNGTREFVRVSADKLLELGVMARVSALKGPHPRP
jgi:hypothetical protein